MSFDQGQFTVTAAGADIWGTSDQFHFVYQQVTGDVDVLARVDSLAVTDTWAKAGVMIRGSLTVGSMHAMTVATGGQGVAFQRRPQDGAISEHTGASGSVPRWVRLTRIGSTLTAYSSADGRSWSTIGSRTIALSASAYVGVAVTSHNANAATSAVLSQVAVVPLTLPEPQRAVDIGAPAIAGLTTFREGTYTIQAAGADIWGSSDQFHFVYQPVTGDVEVTARVTSLANTNAWAKTGVMIRESLTAGSRHAAALATVGNGYVFHRRIDAGGITQNTKGPLAGPPGWVRLVRTGSQIEAFHSPDGVNWTPIGVDAVPMADTVYVGIATTSHDTSRATSAVLDSFKVTAAGSQTNQPPQVAMTSPADGTTVTAGTNLPLVAAASDTDGTIQRVDFLAGTTPIGSDTTAPYQVTWQAVPAGTYTLTAVASDNDGAKTTSAAVRVTAQTTANQPPTATLTAPANGAAFTAPATITLSASASDPGGTVARVEFYAGTTRLNTDTSAPYTFTWSSVAAGTYALRAVAYDNAGASGSSATSSITVTNAASSGLAAAYGLNEGMGTVVRDASAAGPDGTVSGATWTAGKYGQALSFARNGEVVFGDLDFTGAFTVMGWLQTRSLYTNTCGSFVMKALDYGFEICGGRLYAGVGSNGAWTGRVSQALTSADLNTWKHVAITYDGSTVRFYANGALVNSAAGAHTPNNNPLLLGHWMPSGEYWDGLIDEVRLYDRVLTQAEIQTVMNTPIGGAGNQPPAATLTAPANGASFTAPATIAMSATASDPENSLARVEFYSGTTLLGTDTTAPYAVTWPSVPAGTYSLRAVAYDTAGASASSAARSIVVTTTTTSPPTAVAFHASADHATVVTRYELRIFANGVDPATGTPIATSDLGKPTPDASGDITVNRATFFSGLAAGTYVAAVAAIGSGGSASSAGVTFTR